MLKNISALTSSLTKSIFKLFFASLFVKSADKGFKNIGSVINKLITLSTKLTKNKKEINEGAKVAKKITVLTGNLLITSIFLTIAAVTGVPALLGAKLLLKIVNKTLPIAKKLSKHKKDIGKAVGSALILAAFTGLMAASSLFLATIAVTGIPALLGSVLMYGIIKLNILTCKMISKSLKHIVIGSIGMAVMSVSLFLFGVALNKIATATKGVNFKQVGVIATLTLLFGGAVAILGIPAVAPFILLGSVSMAVMGLALRPFAKTLASISKSTKGLKIKDILVITGSMVSLGLGIAAMSLLTVPIALGSVVVRSMSNILYKFTKSLKILSELGEPPTDIINQTLKTIGVIGKFFINNPIKKNSIKQAKRYKKILKPFGDTIKYLSKLKELGEIPMGLVNQTLNAINSIANYYIDNPIKKKAIKRAKRYKQILKPFGNTIKYLSKLKELGEIPMGLINQTLNVINTIANYYIDNPIKKKAIKRAKRYKKILRPFGNTIKYLSKLKEMGEIPMDLVNKTLNVISTIANYYIDNPIKKKAIKRAKRYKKILEPFGDTIKYLSELKELDYNSIKSSIKSIAMVFGFLKSNSFNRKQRRRALKTISILNEMTSMMSTLQNTDSSNISTISDAISNSIGGVDKVDISKIQAVTNMFNAFNGINKSESIIDKFTESVKDFTETCKNLMDAMSDNTNAINNIENIGSNGSTTKEIKETNIIEKSSNGDDNKTGGIRISNVDEIAKTIAEKINGALSLDIPDTQIQLLINGTGGNEWIITRY